MISGLSGQENELGASYNTDGIKSSVEGNPVAGAADEISLD